MFDLHWATAVLVVVGSHSSTRHCQTRTQVVLLDDGRRAGGRPTDILSNRRTRTGLTL